MEAGAFIGNLVGATQGVYEMTVGASMMVGGTAGGVATSPTGVGAVAGAGVAVAGAAVTAHGAAVTYNGLKNATGMIADRMSRSAEPSAGTATTPQQRGRINEEKVLNDIEYPNDFDL